MSPRLTFFRRQINMMTDKSMAPPTASQRFQSATIHSQNTVVSSIYSRYSKHTTTQHTVHTSITEFQPSFDQITGPDCQNNALNAEQLSASIYTPQRTSPVWPLSFEMRRERRYLRRKNRERGEKSRVCLVSHGSTTTYFSFLSFHSSSFFLLRLQSLDLAEISKTVLARLPSL